MSWGGARAGAGRPKGSRSQKTIELAITLSEQGLTPLEYMLQIMRDETQTENMRLDAAKSAAPYIHPRLSSQEISGTLGVHEMTHEQWLESLK